jgi:2-oxo-3-hexenedioate decarboxylase
MTNNEIAEILHKAAFSRTPVSQMAEAVDMSLDQAYSIQQLLLDKRTEVGEELTGYKLGFTSKAKMKQMNVNDLIWGFLTDAMEIKSGSEVPISKYIHPRAEPEIAFKVKKDITSQISLSQVPEYIEAFAVAIEVIDSRYENFKFSLEDVIADNCSSTGYCIGEWLPLVEDLNQIQLELLFDDKVVQQGYTQAILDNPYESVVELSRLATQAGLILKKGQIILAGAATAAEWITPSVSVKANLQGFGEAAFHVVS